MANWSVPVEAIDAEARTLDPDKTLRALIRLVGVILLTVPYALGWLTRKLWIGLALLWTAAVVGWREAGQPQASEGGSV